MRCSDVSGSAICNKPANGTIHQNLKFKAIKCDPPWESREKGERMGMRVMTWHAKRVTYLSDMRICNKQNKECHGRYCFAC